jgi:type I restriction enzyme S subunit
MNLGKVIWTRPELDGLVASHDLIRIEPNAKAAPPGFLFAFLAGRYGHALIRKQIYGGHIKHIEPEHIADLPVPRLKNGLEQKVHDLVKRAAHLRAEAATEISRIDASVVASLGLPDLGHASVGEFSVSSVVASRLNLRLDAAYHCDAAIRSTRAVEAARSSVALLSIVVKRYFKPPMFKRLWVDNSSYGRQFVSGADVYRYQAESTRYVSFKTPKFDDFILEEGTVIFQAAGEISGLVGRPLFVSGWLVGLFAADDLYRLVPRTVEDGGYLYTFFRTTVGQVLLKRQACGDSIPRIWDPHIRDIRVPWPDAGIRREIGSAVVHAHSKIERARLSETEAISLVEQAIEGRC